MHKETKLEDLVQVALVRYIHFTQHSEWQDTIPPSVYHNFEEKQQKTLRKTCLFMQIYGKKNISLMKIPNLHN
jgi:hypothetical protein